MAGIGVGAGFNAGLASARQRRYDDEDRQRALARDDVTLESARFGLDQAREAQQHTLTRRPVVEAAQDQASDLSLKAGQFNLDNAQTNAAHSNELYQRQLAALKQKGEQEGMDGLIRSLGAGVDPQRAVAQFNQQGDHKIDSIEYDPTSQRVKIQDRYGGFDGTLPQLQHAFGVEPTPVKLDAHDRLVDPRTLQTVVPPALGFDDESVENQAQLIANGQAPAITGYSLSRPFGQAVMSRVAQLGKEREASGGNAYSAGDFASKSKAMRDFNTGQQGNAVRFMNTAISHINTLQDLGRDLDNGNVQAVNRLKTFWKTQSGEAAPASFQAARDIVANEVVKAVTASGGALADRQEAQQQLSAASSWSQLAGVADTWKQLLAGQLGSLRLQYEQGTGLKDFDKKLYPETLRELSGAENQGAPSGAGASDVTATGPNGQKIVLRNGQWVPLDAGR